MQQKNSPQLPRPPQGRDLAAACQTLDALGTKYVIVGEMIVSRQGFSRPADQVDLQVQCSELNRQAVMPAPAPLVRESVQERTRDTRS